MTRRRKYDPALDQAAKGFWQGLAVERDAQQATSVTTGPHAGHVHRPMRELLRDCRSCGEAKLAFLAGSSDTLSRLAAARIARTDPALRLQYADLLQEQGYEVDVAELES